MKTLKKYLTEGVLDIEDNVKKNHTCGEMYQSVHGEAFLKEARNIMTNL